MDDTLYDEIDYCRSGFAATADYVVKTVEKAKHIPSETVFNALWAEFMSGNTKTTFNSALDELAINYDIAFIKTLVGVYREHKPMITLPEDSRSVLDTLCHDYRLGMVTDGFLPAQELKVDALGIEKYFDPIIFTERLGREFWKPSPVGFEKILEKHKELAENCIYIADNAEKDFIAPNQLGMVTVQLIRTNKIHKSISDNTIATPRHKIKDITALPACLKNFRHFVTYVCMIEGIIIGYVW